MLGYWKQEYANTLVVDTCRFDLGDYTPHTPFIAKAIYLGALANDGLRWPDNVERTRVNGFIDLAAR